MSTKGRLQPNGTLCSIHIFILSLQGWSASARQPRGRRELPRRAQQLLPGRRQVPRRLLPPQEAHHLRTALVQQQ